MYILLCCDTLMNVTCDIHVSVGQYMLEQHLLLCVTLTHFQKNITVLLLIACPCCILLILCML